MNGSKIDGLALRHSYVRNKITGKFFFDKNLLFLSELKLELYLTCFHRKDYKQNCDKLRELDYPSCAFLRSLYSVQKAKL